MVKLVLKLLSLCGMLIALIPPATAQQEDHKKVWEETLAAAKAEREVVVATSPDQVRRQLLQKMWQQEYPDIKLNLTSVGGNSFFPKLATERGAGKFLWDIWQSGPGSARDVTKKGFFDPLVPELVLPEVSDPAIWGGWDEAFYDDEKKFLLGTISDIGTPYYNSDVISPERIEAEGLKVMLDPAFKGKIVWYDPRRNGPGGQFLPVLARELGMEGLKKLVVEQKPIFVSDFNQVAEAMVRGKAVIAMTNKLEAALHKYVEAGIKINIRPFGNSAKVAYLGTSGSSLAVFNARPHPNAARVFVNWYLTKNVQAEIAKAVSFSSSRTDVPPVVPGFERIPGQNYVFPQKDDGEGDRLREQVKKWRS